jgi:hypothetical protein
LQVVQGPCNFGDLKRVEVDGQLRQFDTFYDAAAALNLLKPDNLWQQTAIEAMRMISSFRQRIVWMAYFLLRVEPIDAKEIVYANLDFLESHRDWPIERRYQRVLRQLEAILRHARHIPGIIKKNFNYHVK